MQKTEYEMRISDWSSDVCSSDLIDVLVPPERARDASAALVAHGFAEIDTYPRRWIAQRHHHLPMHRHSDTGVGVEMQTSILFPRFDPILRAHTVRRAAVAVVYRDRPASNPVPAPSLPHNTVPTKNR